MKASLTLLTSHGLTFQSYVPREQNMEFHLSLSSLSNVKQVREFFLIFSMCLYESIYHHFWRQHHTRKETLLSTHFQKVLTLPLGAWPIFRSPPIKGLWEPEAERKVLAPPGAPWAALWVCTVSLAFSAQHPHRMILSLLWWMKGDLVRKR